MRLVPLIVLAALTASAAVRAQTPTSDPTKEKETPKKSETLDQLIAEALKNNPDLRVVEAKLRLDELEAARARMKLSAEITQLHADIEAAQAAAKEGKARYDRAKSLHEKGAISAEDLAGALLTWTKLKTELASLQGRMPYLLGRQAVAGGPKSVIPSALWQESTTEPISDDEFARRTALDILGRLPTPQELKDFLAQPQKDRREKWIKTLHSQSLHANMKARIDFLAAQALKTDSPLAAKLQKALDAPILGRGGQVEFVAATPKEVLDFVRDKALPGINLVVRADSERNLAKGKASVRKAELILKQVKLAASLSAAAIEEAKAVLEAAKAQLALAKADKARWQAEFDRAQKLVEKGVYDKATADEVAHQLKAAQAAEEVAKAKANVAADAAYKKAVLQREQAEAAVELAQADLDAAKAELKKDSVTFKLSEPIPAGAVLELIEDELGVVFILRDYGIVVVSADEKLPPGALRVVDFWKHGAAPKAPTPPAK